MSSVRSRLGTLLRAGGPIALACAATSVSCHYPEGYGCPDVDYVPTGPVLDDGCGCEAGVPYMCYSGCAGEFGVVTCEPVDAIREFLQTECATCLVQTDSYYGGVLYNECGFTRY